MKIKEKICLSIGSVVILSFILVTFVIWPLMPTIEKAPSIEQITEKQNLEQELISLKQKVLGPEQIIIFIQKLEQIAQENNNKLALRAIDCENLCFQIILEGEFLNFLKKLENLPYLINAESLSTNFEQSNLKIRIYNTKDAG